MSYYHNDEKRCIPIAFGNQCEQVDAGNPLILTRMDLYSGLVEQLRATDCDRDRSVVVRQMNEVNRAITNDIGSKDVKSLLR